jgi:hypothetical protein
MGDFYGWEDLQCNDERKDLRAKKIFIFSPLFQA